MKIACISASNTRLTEDKSTSARVSSMLKEMIVKASKEEVSVDLIALKDYDIKPCVLCGACYENGKCIHDEEFNQLIRKLEGAHAIMLVVPHYSPIPAKLMIIFEKINEITYAGWLNDPHYLSPFHDILVGIIGHGGMVESEDTLKYYHDHLVTPVASTLKSLSFQIIKPNDEFPNGVTFGLKDDTCLRKSEASLFPDIIQDWSMIENRIQPLVTEVITALSNR